MLSSGSNGYILGSFHVLKEYNTPIGIVKVPFFTESKVPSFFAFFEILFAIDNSSVTWVEKISSGECVNTLKLKNKPQSNNRTGTTKQKISWKLVDENGVVDKHKFTY